MLLGLGEWAPRGASRSVIIPHLQVFLLPWSLSSLVKRKSICTDVYEKGDCLVERGRRRRGGGLGMVEKGEKKCILIKWTSHLEN